MTTPSTPSRAQKENRANVVTRNGRAAVVTNVHNRAEDKPWQPGEQLRAIRAAEITSHTIDPRLPAQRTADGYTLQGEFHDSLVTLMVEGSEIISRVTHRESKHIKYFGALADRSDLREGERGLEFALTNPGEEIVAGQAKFRGVRMDLERYAVFVPVTNEMVEDNPNLETELDAIAAEELRLLHENGIINGPGGRQLYGVTNAPARIEIAIEDTQTIANTADFIVKNTAKMAARSLRYHRSAFFLNPELYVALCTANTGGTPHPLVGPPTEVAPYGSLHGRPLIPNETAPPEGNVGDIALMDLSDYLLVSKGTMRKDISVHVRFFQDESIFRFIIRVNGQPMQSKAVTPVNGGDTRSNYVFLAARS